MLMMGDAIARVQHLDSNWNEAKTDRVSSIENYEWSWWLGMKMPMPKNEKVRCQKVKKTMLGVWVDEVVVVEDDQ